MGDIPRAVLSEHFQDRMKDRRLVSAIFTTFCLEPGFFETEVLPVFLDVPLSHAPPIRLVQLEDALRSLPGHIAVYYDANGLVPEGGSAKLDWRRAKVHHATGIFHPKNVFALVEDAAPDKAGNRNRALLCACMSANLTRAGWWENVEVAHVEEILEGAHTSLRADLIAYINALVAAAEGRRRANDTLRESHDAVRDVLEFLGSTTQREHRSVDGRLLPRFHGDQASLPDFLDSVAGTVLRGMRLEIISPYFDESAELAPLQALRERFSPPEMRVFLPRNDLGEARCAKQLFEWVRKQADISWGMLAVELRKRGEGSDVKPRTVHAKVYRFFEPKRGGREILYVGSTNLTTPGCKLAGRGGNWEAGYLVEVKTSGRPDWWLKIDARKPLGFETSSEDEGTASSGGTRLSLRYHWDRKEGFAHWHDSKPSPALAIRHGGVLLFEVRGLPAADWSPIGSEASAILEDILRSTSLLEVIGDGSEPGLLLVQEEGMSHRPSILLELSAADILKYWSLLTVEQRNAFLENRIPIEGDDNPLVTKLAALAHTESLFDRFAGIFHAFECLMVRVRESIVAGNSREANDRLFGRKYDSLGTLLGRVLGESEAGCGDRVGHYVVTLCAEQLLGQVKAEFPDFFAEHENDAEALRDQIARGSGVRAALAREHAEMPEFLDWFEKWFLRRAEPLEQGAAP